MRSINPLPPNHPPTIPMPDVLIHALHTLGDAALGGFWVPLAAWTLGAILVEGVLRSPVSCSALAWYRVRQALLLALPAGILLSAGIDLSDLGVDASGAAVLYVTGEPIEATVSAAGSAPAWTWTHLVGAATLVAGGVALVQLGRLVADGVRLALARPSLDLVAHPGVARIAHKEARRLGVRRPARALVSRRDVSPMTLPGWTPTVVVPASMADAPDALRMTMAHEMVHVRRYDDWAAIGERVLAALFAVHPLVHLIARSLSHDREMACDAEVLQDHTVRRGSYARLLLDFADRSHALRSVALSEQRSMLTDRLDAMRSSIARPSKLRVGAAVLALLAGVSVLVVACSDSVTPPKEATTQTSSQTAPSATDSNDWPPDTVPQPSTTADDVYVVAEEPPKLKGGISALQREVTYPDDARANGIEGRVFVQFVVDENGVPQNVSVTRGVHASLDREAVRATRKMRFEPGEQRGRDVKVQMSLPVTFRLNR